MIDNKKRYVIKVTSDSYRVWIWSDTDFNSFKKTINGGLGELTLILNRPWDDFGFGNDVAYNNNVKIYVYDAESSPSGKLIYNGYIAEINPWFNNKESGVNVICIGYITKFDDFLFYAYIGGIKTTPISYSNVDITLVIKDIIAHIKNDQLLAYGLDPKFILTYDKQSVLNTGITTGNITFELQTCQEALNKCHDLARQVVGFYHYLDVDGKFHWKKFGERKHIFTLGRHLNKLDLKTNMRDVVNYIWLDNGLKKSDPTSATDDGAENDVALSYRGGINGYSLPPLFGWREKLIRLNFTRNNTPLNSILYNYLIKYAFPSATLKLTLVDSNINPATGYDIESIEPGDLCQINNLPKQYVAGRLNDSIGLDSTPRLFAKEMIILSVNYKKTSVELDIAPNKRSMSQDFSNLSTDVDDSKKDGTITEWTDLPVT